VCKRITAAPDNVDVEVDVDVVMDVDGDGDADVVGSVCVSDV
jgi:hypothetical protein